MRYPPIVALINGVVRGPVLAAALEAAADLADASGSRRRAGPVRACSDPRRRRSAG